MKTPVDEFGGRGQSTLGNYRTGQIDREKGYSDNRQAEHELR